VGQAGQDRILLEAKELNRQFPIRRSLPGRVVGYVEVVDGVRFPIKEGETLALEKLRLKPSRRAILNERSERRLS